MGNEIFYWDGHTNSTSDLKAISIAIHRLLSNSDEEIISEKRCISGFADEKKLRRTPTGTSPTKLNKVI